MKSLIIAEKPSVATDIARVLGGFTKHDDYFENDEFVVSSAVGHLLEICVPEEFEVKRGKWTFDKLPMIPPHFDLRPIEKTEGRLKVLLKLIKRKDVASLINACDAGREGELIFRYIAQHSKTEKPIKRLWLQSMTPNAIKEGFSALRKDEEVQPLANAAVCRSESDWIVGINGTRAMTAFNSKSGGFHLTTVGRVQTPTLALLVDREEKIRKHVPKDYWELHGTFVVESGEYEGRWFDETFSKSKDAKETESDHLKPERIWDEKKAEAIRTKCLGKPGIITEESKPTTQLSPLLYDLTSLQREANGRFGFSARATLQLAQSLYERHKALTYPRTDSRALPEDYLPTVRNTLETLKGTEFGRFAKEILDNQWVKPNKRIFNNAKISDHFAIIPTTLAPKNLSEPESKLYGLVTRRFLAVFFPAAEFLVTTRITRVLEEPFKTEGKVMVKPGWRAIYGQEADDDETPNLTAVEPGETAETREIEIVYSQTKPPARFSEATLLSAMEGAGKAIEDDELREAMSERGLGTPATRAAIIEGLLYEQYLLRQGRELQPTPKAFSLMTLLRGLGVKELTSPEMTGEWEHKLKLMERGKMSREDFMREIEAMTRHIVAQAKAHESDTVPGDFGELKIPCPKCGGQIKENYKKFQCQGCDFSLWKIVAGRQFDLSEIEELIEKRTVGPLQGFRSKMGKPFAALIKLTDELKPEFDFGQGSDSSSNEPVDFSQAPLMGKCPKCGAHIYEQGMHYLCEKSTGPEKSCDFRTGKVILQRNMEPEQVKKMLETGKTDLLHKFISKKGRPFSAYLTIGEGGKTAFEFEPRAPKGAAKGAKTKRAKKKASAKDEASEEA